MKILNVAVKALVFVSVAAGVACADQGGFRAYDLKKKIAEDRATFQKTGVRSNLLQVFEDQQAQEQAKKEADICAKTGVCRQDGAKPPTAPTAPAAPAAQSAPTVELAPADQEVLKDFAQIKAELEAKAAKEKTVAAPAKAAPAEGLVQSPGQADQDLATQNVGQAEAQGPGDGLANGQAAPLAAQTAAADQAREAKLAKFREIMATINDKAAALIKGVSMTRTQGAGTGGEAVSAVEVRATVKIGDQELSVVANGEIKNSDQIAAGTLVPMTIGKVFHDQTEVKANSGVEIFAACAEDLACSHIETIIQLDLTSEKISALFQFAQENGPEMTLTGSSLGDQFKTFEKAQVVVLPKVEVIGHRSDVKDESEPAVLPKVEVVGKKADAADEKNADDNKPAAAPAAPKTRTLSIPSDDQACMSVGACDVEVEQ